MDILEKMTSKMKKNFTQNTHFHPETEILFVVQGNLKVMVKDTRHELTKGDILLLNSGLSHSVETLDNSIVCMVSYSCQILSETLNREKYLFACDSVNDKTRSYKKLREIFYEIVYQYASNAHKTDCMEKSLLYKMLDMLIEEHLLEEPISSINRAGDDVRLMQMIQYVDQNFQYNVSLSQLADHMFVSKSTLSRFFKKQTGMYFADYVNSIRMRAVLENLFYTNRNITQIALECGFSSLPVFNKVFHETYGMPPSDYRKKECAAFIEKKEKEQKVQEQICKQLKKEILKQDKEPLSLRVKVDMSQGTYYEKNWNKTINIGALDSLLLANIQYHVLYLTENIGFSYARFWNVFSEKMMVTDGKHIGNYSYDQLDTVLDFLVSNHIIPFLDMGLRPDTAVISGNDTLYFRETGIQFASRETWEAMVEDFIHHIVLRYGETEIEKWIFELSLDCVHEPKSHCYAGREYNYFDTFFYLYNTLKKMMPEIQVGGPMQISDWPPEATIQFLHLCKEHSCIPDFISFALFPYETFIKEKQFFHKRITRKDYEEMQIGQMQNILKESGVETKIYISEWNNSLSNRNYMNDSCFRAAYMAKCINASVNKVHMMNIWMASDWVSNYYDTRGVANGGCGLLTKDTICKPAYFLLVLMNHLGECLVKQDDGYMITKTEQDEYYILCYNYKWYSYDYFINNENILSLKNIKDKFEDSNPVEISIILDNIQNGIYVVKKRSIAPDTGNLLNEWASFQFDNELSSADVKYIRQACYPRISMEKAGAKNKKLELHMTLKAHEVVLLHIYQN